MIRTERLRLQPLAVADFSAVLEGDAALEQALGLRVADRWVEPEHRAAVASGAEHLAASPAAAAWWTYVFVHEVDATLIGAGGFKGPPDAGVVEIGYGVAPAYRGQGLAFEAAEGLLRFALAHPGSETVQAHTLPEANASTRILQRLGMTHVQTLVDPDDGPVWRWSRSARA